ncbi:Acetamidase [Orbilia brochopaga]|nr:Acetamidase [Drechslerella brochopaga]
MPSNSTLRYIYYPRPKEIDPSAVEAKYSNPPANNPRVLWNNAQFGALKHLKILDEYTGAPCAVPCVIPRESDDASVTAADDIEVVDAPVDTAFYTSADYVRLYQGGKVTPTQVVQKLLDIITKPPHNAAVVQVLPEVALAAARASTERYEKGAPLGPLDGVPIAVKDEIFMHAYQTTFGAAKVFDKGEGETSWCVQKLEEAGAIVVAKSSMHECGSDVSSFCRVPMSASA